MPPRRSFITTYKEQHGLEYDEGDDDPLDQARARTLQVPPPPLLGASAGPLEQPQPYRCASCEGFSLHANVDVPAQDRDALLRLVRYGARQAFTQSQLHERQDGRLAYTLKAGRGGSGS